MYVLVTIYILLVLARCCLSETKLSFSFNFLSFILEKRLIRMKIDENDHKIIICVMWRKQRGKNKNDVVAFRYRNIVAELITGGIELCFIEIVV